MNTERYTRPFLAFIVCLLLVGPHSAWAQKVSIVADTVNAGRTGFRVPVTATFRLHNGSSRHINIKDVKTDCGCMLAEYPHSNIAADDTATITITYDAGMLGHFTKQAAIYYSHSKEPLWVTMKGVVLRDWVDLSKSYPFRFGQLRADAEEIEFDNVNKGDMLHKEIHIFNNSEQPMEPRLLHLPPYLQAELMPALLPAGEPGTIRLTLNTSQLHDYGLTQTNVYMAQKLGEKISPDTEMPVSVVLLPDMSLYEGTNSDMAPRLYLSQDSLVMGIINGKMQNKAVITVGNMGKSTLDISSLQLFTRGMTVTLDKRQLKPQETTRMKLTIDRDKLMTARSRPRVLMITNDPQRPKATIRIKVL